MAPPSSYADLKIFESEAADLEKGTIVDNEVPVPLSDLETDITSDVPHEDPYRLKSGLKEDKKEEEKDDRVKIIPRRVAAMRAFISVNVAQLTELGVRLPVSFGFVLPAIRSAGMYLLKEALTSQDLKDNLKERFIKMKQTFNQTKGKPLNRMAKAALAGITNMSGGEIKKVSNKVKNSIKQAKTAAKAYLANPEDEQSKEKLMKLYARFKAQLSRLRGPVQKALGKIRTQLAHDGKDWPKQEADPVLDSFDDKLSKQNPVPVKET